MIVRVRQLASLSSLLFLGCGGAPAEPIALVGANTGGSEQTAGMAGGGQGGGVGLPDSDEKFQLLYRDDFDALDTSKWQLMTHSWNGNMALFSSESVTVADGKLSIALLDAPEGTKDDSGNNKSFLGAEVRSVQAITYGRVKARAKLARGSAVVSSLVTIYTPWPADNWNELDIEMLGKDPSQVQFNAMVYKGTLPAAVTPVTPTQDPMMYSLGFDASEEFHEYTIEWTPESARYLIDGKLAHTWDASIELMTLPQNILLTIWASNSAAWAGPVDASTSGAQAVYDWIEVYTYVP